jgi:hypothetical protein
MALTTIGLLLPLYRGALRVRSEATRNCFDVNRTFCDAVLLRLLFCAEADARMHACVDF